MRALISLLLLLPTLAHAGAQRGFDVDKGSREWAFDYRWQDADGQTHAVSFALPAASVDEDRQEKTGLARKEMYEHAAAAVRKWGRTLPDVKVTARVDGGAVHVDVSGPPKAARTAMAEAVEVRDAAIEAWLAEHDYTRVRGGEISFDHARLVSTYSDDLVPVAAALSARAPDPRDYAALALSFVQSIPYEARKKNGGEAGYRRPLALLARNRGDCDSKTVLYLALIRAAHPDIDLAVVYTTDHALGGVALPREAGDRTFKLDGVEYLYVEPVGPALHPFGQAAPENKRAGKKGEVRAVPAPGAA